MAEGRREGKEGERKKEVEEDTEEEGQQITLLIDEGKEGVEDDYRGGVARLPTKEKPNDEIHSSYFY